jgi:hypothetical protein
MNRFLRAIFGIDFAVLRCYPKDLNRFRWGAIAAIVYALLSLVLFKWKLAIAVGVGVFLLYWWFLCKPSQGVGGLSVLKGILVLGLVAFGLYLSFRFLFLLFPVTKDYANDARIIVFYVYGVLCLSILLIIGFVPVRNSNGDYEDAMEELRKKSKSTLATLNISGRDVVEGAIRSWVADMQRQSDEINKAAKQELIKVQQSIIKSALNSWAETMQKDMADTFKNVTTETVKVVGQGLSASELNDCVSKIVAEHQKAFAKIIIDRWAEETKKKLIKDDLNNFILP